MTYVHDKNDPIPGNQGHPSEAVIQDQCRLPKTYNGIPKQALGKVQELLNDEIRILRLDNGAPGTPLTGALTKVPLSGNAVYEPLSYTWEEDDLYPTESNKELDCVLILEGVNELMKLGRNCAKALSHIRYKERHRMLWVGSICVNQDDPVERSQQVSLMHRIYSKPFTVVAYVGHESIAHSSSKTLESLTDAVKCQFDSSDSERKLNIQHFFDRAFFKRMWTVQEVALAQTLQIYCGDASAMISPWAGAHMDTLLRVSRFANLPGSFKHSRQSNIRSNELKPRAQKLLDLILDTASCQCKDPKDKIFALLSLLEVEFESEKRLTADYALSTEHVYTGTGALMVVSGLAEIVLRLAVRLHAVSAKGLPSWVPDWSQLPVDTMGMVHLLSPRQTHHPQLASNDVWVLSPVSTSSSVAETRPAEVSRGGTLKIQAMLLGRVHYMRDSDVRYDNQNLPELRPCHGIWVLNCTSLSPSLFKPEFRLWFPTTEIKRMQADDDREHVAVFFAGGINLTTLILRLDDVALKRYTLVEAGVPLIQPFGRERTKGVPRVSEAHWGADLMESQLPLSKSEHLEYKIIRSKSELFPLMSGFPELWEKTMRNTVQRLSEGAVRRMCDPMLQAREQRLRSLWSKWKHDAQIGKWVLKDENEFMKAQNELVKRAAEGWFLTLWGDAPLEFRGLFPKSDHEKDDAFA